MNNLRFPNWAVVLRFKLCAYAKSAPKRPNQEAYTRSRSGKALLGCGLLSGFLSMASAAVPPTMVYDGFDYSAGSINGANGGTGWTSTWSKTYTPGGVMHINGSTFSYTGLTTVGGKTEYSSSGSTGGNQISQCERDTPLFNSGIVYIQFLSQLESGGSGGGTPQLRLEKDDVASGMFGGNGGTYGAKMSILEPAGLPKSDGTSSTNANLNALNLTVVRINYNTSLTEMWVNPNLSTFDYYNPPAANASWAGLAPQFNSISLITRSPGNFDEVRVMQINGPTDMALSATSINENNTAGAAVGTLTSTDGDVGETFTYSLASGTGDNDNGSFTISGNTLHLTPSANFESKSSYLVRIRSTDSTSATYEEAFTITINNVAETPTDISLSATSVAENVAANTSVGTLSTTDPDTGNTFTYTLVTGTGDTDNGAFNISGSSLRITNSPDYETRNNYSIRVRSTDSGTLFFEKQFTITITNINEAPTISDITNQSTNEDIATSALAFTIGDAETAAGSLTLSSGSSNTAVAPLAGITFGGSGSSRTVTIQPAGNASGTSTITISVSDGTNTTSDTFTLTVNAVNDAPTIGDVANQTVNEDVATSALAFTVGDVETAAASLTMSGSSSDTAVVPNANIVFGGSGTNRTVTITPAANAFGTATITITVSDGVATASDTFTMTVTAVNDAPTISDVTNQTVNEDVATSALVFTVGDVETAVASLTMSAGSSNTTLVPVSNIVFGGSGASRTVTVTPAANASGTSTITLTVNDGTTTTNDTFLLTVNAVNDAPTISDVTDQTINEDNATSALAITIGDVETAAASLTMSGSSSNTTLVPNTNIVFGGSGANRTVTVTPVANGNGSSTITLTASDGSQTGSDTFVLTVNAVNDAPSYTGLTYQLAYETTNPSRDGSNNIVYTVNNGAALAGASFNRVRYRMEVDVSGVPRYAEASFDAWTGLTVATVKVPDASNPVAFHRDVTNLSVTSNYAGVVNATGQTGRVEIWPSNYAQGISNLFTPPGSNVTYDYDDNTYNTAIGHGSFQVHNLSSTPIQTVLAWNSHHTATPEIGFGNFTGTHPDWTFAGSNGLGKTNWKMQISIGTEGLPSTFTVAEDTTSNLLMYGTPIVDPDSSSLTVTLEISDGVITGNAGTGITVGGSATARTFTGSVADLNAYFTTAGKVTYLGAANNLTSRTLTVTTNDGGGSPTVATSTVNFTPVNDVPTDIALSANTLAENNAANATVGTLSSTDLDTSDTFTYSFVTGTGDTDNGSFNILSNALRLTGTANYETKGVYSVRIRSTDSGGGTYDKAFTINITNVAEAPTDITLSNSTLAENVAANTTVGTFSTTDQDTSETFTYSLVTGAGSTDNASFEIFGGNSLRLLPSPNYEAKPTYALRIRTTDSATLNFEKAFTITITNVNEGPTISDIADQTINEDANTGALSFTITDPETAVGSLTVSAASTNTTLVPVVNAVLAGTTGTRTVTVTPVANLHGTATITITVSDGTLTASDSFILTVNPVNDVPSFTLPAVAAGGTWVARDSARTWYSMASSADGTKLVAGAHGGLLYTSTDSGATWTSRNGPTTLNYHGVASSEDGTKLAAVVRSGQIYTSTDSGVSWTIRASTRVWTSIASSSDGTKLVATVEGGYVVTSTDSGVTWTNRDIQRAWWGVASSTDGTKLVATVNGGQIYTSTDSGANWTARDSTRYWRGVASSSDGTKLVAAELNGKLYTSTDSGVTWTARDSNREWVNVASSADGVRLVAAAKNNNIYTSTDSGVTWTGRETARAWWSVASSADGSKIAAGIENGQIYTSTGSGTYGVTVAEDAGAQTTASFATNISAGPANESAQVLTFNASNNNNTLFSAQPALASNGALTFTTATNANGTATVTVSLSDDGGTANGGVNTSATQTFTITASSVNDTPTDIALSATSIAENNSASATVGTLSSTDIDAGDTATFTLATGTGDTDNGSFTVSGTSLRLTPSANFEVKSSYSVRIRVTDGSSATYEEAFAISITDVYETPTDMALSTLIITESVAANSTVATISTTDVDTTDSFTYALASGAGSTDNAAFNILGNALRINSVPHQAAKSSYAIRLRTTDAGGLWYEEAFTLTVIAPEIVVQEGTTVIADGSSRDFGPVVYGSASTLTYTIKNIGNSNLSGMTVTLSGTSAASFNITTQPTASISGPTGETTFVLECRPVAFGALSATLQIANNDYDEAPFDITLSGFGGDPGASLAFDGVNDTLQIGAHADFNTPTFTIEGWVKPGNLTPEWSRLWATQNNQGDLIIRTGSEKRFSFAPIIDGEFYYVRSPVLWTADQWYHVAGVVDENMVRLFVNGVQVASRAKTKAWQGDSAGARFIGRCTAPNPPNRFKGVIDEVRYWNYARNCDQIYQARTGELTGSEPGLVAYYKFNQGIANGDNSAQTSVTDATGHGHTGTLTNFNLTDGNSTSNWTMPGGVTSGALAPVPQFVEINLKGNAHTILDGDTTPRDADHTDFGDTSVSSTRTFTLENLGNIDLSISDIALSGENAADFEIGDITFPVVLAGGDSTTFTVTVDSTTTETRVATLTITSTDCDEGAYDIAIQSVPPIEITTTAGALAISDPTSVGTALEASEPAAGSIEFTSSSRAFIIDGGARHFGESGAISLSGISTITIEGSGGDDEIEIDSFTGLPSLAVMSSPGVDTLNFAGEVAFAEDADLTIDLTGSVRFLADASVTASGDGAIAITTSKGVSLAAGSVLVTEDGDLTVAANQQTVATAGNFTGVQLSGGTIRATGTGAVTVRGKGGDSTSGQQAGVRLLDGGEIKSDSGLLTVQGTGGASTGVGNYGVQVTGSGSTISSTAGNVSVTGIEGTGASGIAIVGQSSSSFATAASTGTLTLIGNSMLLDGTTSVTAPSGGSVTVLPLTNGVGISLGLSTNSIGGPLALTDAELDRISAGTLNIGDANSGALVQSAAISRSSATTLNLASGGAIDLRTASIGTGGGSLRLNAAAGASAPGNGLDIDTGTLSFTGGSAVSIAIDGPLANSGYQQFNVQGSVNLTGATLNLTGAHTPVKGQCFVLINNDGTDAVTGAFAGLAQGSTVLFKGVPMIISYTGGSGNDVTLGFAAPTLTVAKPTLGITEGGTITNSGTVLDLQGNVTLSANMGSVTNLGNGNWTWTYTPADGPDASGTVIITAQDDSTVPLSTTVSFALAVKNVAPVAEAQTVTLAEDASSSAITLGASDAGSDSLTYAIVSSPKAACGTLATISGNVVNFTPAPGFAGTVSFTFKATDSDGAASNTATVTINVIGSNDAPEFTKGSNRVHPTGTATTQSVPNWATAISDGDAELNQTLSFTVTEVGDSGIFTTAPAISDKGALTYQPNGASGTATFSVTLTDSGGATCAAQTFTITVANFSPGAYTGLAEPDENTTPSRNNLGLFSGTLTGTGSFSAKVNFGGTTTAFTTSFSLSSGNASGTLGSTLAWNLHLDVLGGTDKITGTVTRLSGSVVTDVCEVDADRATFSTANKVPARFLNSASSGVYTLAFPAKEQTPEVDTDLYPQGDGFGKITLSATGGVTFSGTLADGTTVTASAPLSKTFKWPLAVLIKASTTVSGTTLGGMVQFNTTPADSDLSASDLLWFRPALSSAKYYAAGWPAGICVDAVGALYSSTTNIQTTLGVTTNEGPTGGAELVLSDGKLTETIVKSAIKVSANLITKGPGAGTTYTLTGSATTGAFTGTFTPNWSSPATTKPTFKGIFIQKGSNKGGYGFFLSNAKNDLTPKSGGVTFSTP